MTRGVGGSSWSMGDALSSTREGEGMLFLLERERDFGCLASSVP